MMATSVLTNCESGIQEQAGSDSGNFADNTLSSRGVRSVGAVKLELRGNAIRNNIQCS